MTLKNQIALTFTLITSGILIGICGIIYYFSYQYTRSDFYQRLQERVNVVAAFALEEDELNQKLFNEIRRKYLQPLPTEQEFLINLDSVYLSDTLPAFINNNFINAINRQRFVAQTYHDTSVVGIRYEDNQGDFAVIVAAQDRSGIRKLHNLGRVLFAVVIGYLVLVFFIGRWYARQAIAPLNDFIHQMRTLNTTNLHLRLPERGKGDEISQLARTFNNLLNRIETSIETQNNFISNASHELKTPLTVILGEIEIALAQEESSADNYRRALLHIEQEAERLKRLTLRLLKLAQTGFTESGREFASARLDELLIEVIEEIHTTNLAASIRLHFHNMPEETQELEILANANLLKIAFANIIENAVKFSGGQPVEVALICEPTHYSINIHDLGIGIPAKDLDKIFEPFFRSENAIHFQGFGVGLPLVKKIIDIHEGTIDIQSIPQQGTQVSIILPRPAAQF
ncbi:MAG TPA: HAMP domain-containing sensor histidine kinase [Saprospiraceae bacterium]|nr:HAMP domain-containing sensor histidine kinase [Saprospiraceae bacterium]HMO40264.1 HAMP domain-containing sensor histidine kinase [Saprospiraceae bacterium]HMP23291.1 HAMP domain-containing sensor histidine kinase [Saprospiraceae bacterium]